MKMAPKNVRFLTPILYMRFCVNKVKEFIESIKPLTV